VPRRTVLFAKITRDPQRRLFDQDFRADMLAATNPQNKTTRYNRTWRFSRPVEVDAEHIAAKLGFTHEGNQERIEYDEEAEDFVVTEARESETVYSHFVIDTTSEVMAFEVGGAIERQSFLGAFKNLLDEADFPATVELLTDPAGLRQWAETVDRVVTIRAVVHNPNPGWAADAGAVRELVQQAEAAVADVTVKASQDGALNVEAAWVNGALQQISTEGQGRMSATGIRKQRESRWVSGQRVRTDSIDEEPGEPAESVWRRLIVKIKDHM
jgi:hypothetical protein